MGGAEPRPAPRAGRPRARGALRRHRAGGGASPSSAIVFWLTWQLLDYEELGDYLIRLGLSWLFLTFLSFLAFSGVVTALSTFFLSEDLRLLWPPPSPRDRLFYSRFARTVGQASWMVVAFLVPVLLAVGRGPLRGRRATTRPSPSSSSPSCSSPWPRGALVTLLLVNVFPARRARDILMLMGLLFAVALVLLLRFLRPERLLNVRVAARRHGLLRHPPVADHAAPALVLGGRDALHRPAGRARLASTPRRPVDDRAGRRRPARAWPSGASTSRAGARPRRPARPASRASSSSSGLARRLPLRTESRQPAREGPEGLPARHHAVVAAPPARGPDRSSTSTTSACWTSTASPT